MAGKVTKQLHSAFQCRALHKTSISVRNFQIYSLNSLSIGICILFVFVNGRIQGLSV